MGLHALDNSNGTATPKQVIDLIDARPKLEFTNSASNVIEGRTTSITVTQAGDTSGPSVATISIVGASGTGSLDVAPIPNVATIIFGIGE